MSQSTCATSGNYQLNVKNPMGIIQSELQRLGDKKQSDQTVQNPLRITSAGFGRIIWDAL